MKLAIRKASNLISLTAGLYREMAVSALQLVPSRPQNPLRGLLSLGFRRLSGAQQHPTAA